MRAPPKLRCVLATRHDVRLGLHRLRLEGEVTEIRAANLRFTLDEARALFGAAGVELPSSALTLLHARTEGWAAGLRLAALSLAGHPDPERFAAEFSGSERTVAERLAGLLAAPHLLVRRVRALQLQAMVRLGETERAERAIVELGEQERERGQIRIATAVLRLAQDHPHAAIDVLAPVLDGSAPVTRSTWLAYAFMLEAIAQEALGDPAAAGRAVERALDLAEPDGTLSVFLLHPAPGLLERHARDCATHAALISEILSLLPARQEGPEGPGDVITGRAGGPWGSAPRLAEPLSQAETRVLRYLPTNLSAPEIARELSVSVNTVRTHIRHVCGKLGAHGRTEAVARARALGLLAPSPSSPRPEASR